MTHAKRPPTAKAGWNASNALVFDSLAADWITALADRGIAPRTRANYSSSIRDLRSWLIARKLPLLPSEITSNALRDWLSDPAVATSGGARKARWTAARSFWGWVHELGIIAVDPTADIPAPRPASGDAVVLMWPGLARSAD